MGVKASVIMDCYIDSLGVLSPIGFGISTTYFVIDMVVGNQLWNIPN